MVNIEEISVNTRVKVRDDYRKPELRGLSGTVRQVWGRPGYEALYVHLKDTGCELFWPQDLDQENEKVLHGRFSRKRLVH